MTFINAEKMPRKLKVCFSNSPKNIPHATYRDLGFVATKEGKFDVYSAGGLGNHARFGVKVAEAVEPEMILYYIKAMWLTSGHMEIMRIVEKQEPVICRKSVGVQKIM